MEYRKIEQKLMNRYGEDQNEACVKMLYAEGWNWNEIKVALTIRASC